MSRYVNIAHLFAYLDKLLASREVRRSPDIAQRLADLRERLEWDLRDKDLFETINIGGCMGCKWHNPSRACVTCRRNKRMRDRYERTERE